MGRLFDQQPTRVRISAFANTASTLFVSAGVFGRDQPQEGHELLGVFEAGERSDLGDRDHGGDKLEALEGHQGIDEGFALPIAKELEHFGLQLLDAFVVEVDGGDVFFQDPVVAASGRVRWRR